MEGGKENTQIKGLEEDVEAGGGGAEDLNLTAGDLPPNDPASWASEEGVGESDIKVKQRRPRERNSAQGGNPSGDSRLYTTATGGLPPAPAEPPPARASAGWSQAPRMRPIRSFTPSRVFSIFLFF